MIPSTLRESKADRKYVLYDNGSESCLLLPRGIVPKINQPESVGHTFRVVEVKKRNCSATTRGNALDTTAVEAKMAIPPLLTWIEEEDGFLRCWVDGSKVCAFETVTVKAGQCQVLKGCRSTVFFSNHMVCFVRIVHIRFVDEAVFTASLSTLLHLTP